MGSLSMQRLVTNERPFSNTGIGYIGSNEVVVCRLKEIRWGELFMCLTVRAVMRGASFELFIPKKLVSDNGTNFGAVSRLLQNEIQIVSSH